MLAKSITALCTTILVLLAISFLYLDRGLPDAIQPASLSCLNKDQGKFVSMKSTPSNIYGVGLAYANHINETASSFSADDLPPIFKKQVSSLLVNAATVPFPRATDLLASLEELDPNLPKSLNQHELVVSPLLDYEVELAVVLLENIQPEQLTQSAFAPKLGFLVGNDVSARSIGILGEGQSNRFEYWGKSKSFPGFSPLSPQIWVPQRHIPNSLPCVILETYVNGQLKQQENTRNLIYTPREMLAFIQQTYGEGSLKKGDIIFTGTPGGITLNVPRWKARLANLLGFDRFKKLSITLGSETDYLQPGDVVRVSAEWLGSLESTIEYQPD